MRGIVEELSAAAEQAVEQAAAEAAKAAAMASIWREAEAWAEAERWQAQYRTVKKAGVKKAVVTGAICFFGGLALGAGGIVLIHGGR